MYVCRKLRLCTFLLKKGFQYVNKREDRFIPNHYVWIFNNTPELQVAIEEYYQMLES